MSPKYIIMLLQVLHMLLLFTSTEMFYICCSYFILHKFYICCFNFSYIISHMLLLFCSPQGNGRKLYYRARTVPTAGVPTSISVPLIEVNTVLPLYL